VSEERKATGVRLDTRCGHVTITGESGPALVTMVDTGQNLELWSHQGAHISPHVARMLADALADWADRKSA
jgi:hypothetical protein